MVAGLTAGALLVPAASASATESHQDLPIVGNDFKNQDCSDESRFRLDLRQHQQPR